MYTLNLFKSQFELNQSHADKSFAHNAWHSPATVEALHRDAAGKPMFLLHDGPPYANGSLHMGHFVNKALKDCLLKFKRLDGYFAPFVPGFDCHGLPVELEVEALGHKKTDPKAFVEACRSYAEGQVRQQTLEFQSFGVSADWEQSYRTLDPAYEAGAAAYFARMPAVNKRLRPVHWCPACASSLAEAEVEYKGRSTDSLVVLFELLDAENTFLQVWTTTPYTLPANKGVAYSASLDYVAVEEGGRTLVRARAETDPLTLLAVSLEGLRARSPYTGDTVPVVAADYVTSSGTGLVHLAPAFGMDDFRVGEAVGLVVEHYVDERGKFLSGAMAGMNFVEATAHVLEQVRPLVYSHTQMEHEYPHCWRHKKPVFFKASEEWFLELDEVGPKALKALESVTFVPASGRERLTSMLRSRSSWCLSRNRLWGTPLVDTSKADELALLDQVARDGVEAWQASGPRRTLDVWFDSGVSHELVLKKRFGRTADVYLEGSDQHRGWFQSSLLTSVAAGGGAPYKALLTHGFVVDEHGRKYSKSSGNYQPLSVMLKQFSPDVLRLWALSQDYSTDMKLSKESLARTFERYKKLRNTLRFCLQNTGDFKRTDVPALTHSLHRDQMAKLQELVSGVTQAAEKYDFAAVVTALSLYCETVSGDYFTALKDTLYCDAPDATARREAQYMLSKMLEALVRLLVPVLPYTAEEVFQEVRESFGYSEETSLLLTLATLELPAAGAQPCAASTYLALKELKHEVNRYVEDNRADGLKGAATLHLYVTLPETAVTATEMLDYFGCARVSVAKGPKAVLVKRTAYEACPRCRRHFPGLLGLCSRCQAVEAMATREEVTA